MGSEQVPSSVSVPQLFCIILLFRVFVFFVFYMTAIARPPPFRITLRL